MSRSRKKVSISTINAGSMKWWRRSVNKILRSRSKQLLRTCRDYDALIMPVIDEAGTLWDSPRDGRGATFWKPFTWHTERQAEHYRQWYLKGFRK